MVRDMSCFSPCVFFTQICLWTFPVSSDKREIRTKSQCQHALYVVSFLQSKMIFYRPSFKVCDTKILQSFSIFLCVFVFVFLLDCLHSFTDLEELDDTELYYCHKCKKRQKSTKKFWIQKLPKVFLYIYIYFNIHFTVSTIKL